MRLIYVEWEDSCSGGGWQRMERILGDHKPATCRSVGWEAKRDRRCITLVPNLATDAAGCEPMTIPLSAVRRIVRLRDPRRKQTRK